MGGGDIWRLDSFTEPTIDVSCLDHPAACFLRGTFLRNVGVISECNRRFENLSGKCRHKANELEEEEDENGP
jgi:hypothetical protein